MYIIYYTIFISNTYIDKLSEFQMGFRKQFAYQSTCCRQLGKIPICNRFVGCPWSPIRPFGSCYHQLSI